MLQPGKNHMGHFQIFYDLAALFCETQGLHLSRQAVFLYFFINCKIKFSAYHLDSCV